ncbi:MAG: hypothetical protein WCH11_01840 [Bdellovibrio sp.]
MNPVRSLQKHFMLGTLVSLAGMNLACEKNSRSFSLLSESQNFQQSTAFAQKNVDILWVIDNSGSMANSQSNLRNNMSAFINRFSTLGVDYQMAVIGTDAWLGDARIPQRYPNPTDRSLQFPGYRANLSLFRDGCADIAGQCLGRTGIYLVNPLNAIQTFVDLRGVTSNVFSMNSALGIQGSGDERAFHSMIAALENPSNQSKVFPRPGSFLSIIILSDEDDFSGDATELQWMSYSNLDRYNVAAPTLQPVDHYLARLDQLMQSRLNYSVSGIFIKDANCLRQLTGSTTPSPSGRIFGTRYAEMVSKARGVAGSLCDAEFYQSLTDISENTLALASSFALNRLPRPESIVVRVNNQLVTPSETDGWVYVSESNAIQFRGSAIPAQGSSISVDYDPLVAKN